MSREREPDKIVLRGDEPDANDEGAASDGDESWASNPTTQDPDVDRSVDATIRRTHGA